MTGPQAESNPNERCFGNFFNVKKEQKERLVSFLSEAASVLDALETHANLVMLVWVPVGLE
jgi:hypothetical protein